MKIILSLFAVVAAAGLVLSAASHGAALAGIEGPLGDSAAVLHIGIFVVWIPAVFASIRLVKNYSGLDYWKAALRGCPGWMKSMTYCVFGYAVLNFALFIIGAPRQGEGGLMPPQVVRGLSGLWMAFYSAALAILYSAAKLCKKGWR